MKALLITVALCACVASASAQDVDKTKLAGNNLSHEHVICGAYFAAVGQCLKTRPDLEAKNSLGSQYSAISETVLERGRLFGLAAGVSEKATIARFQISLKMMVEDMEASCSNISVLFAKYGDSCRALAEDPRPRLEELLR